MGTVVDQAQHAARRVRPWIEWMARIGYAAKGVVYGLVGLYAGLSAVGWNNSTKGPITALRTMSDEWYGPVALIALAIGLAGYALWCVVKATFDAERDGLFMRVIAGCEALFYFSLVAAVVAMMTGDVSEIGDDRQADDWTARLLAWPGGKWAAIVVGIGIAGFGCYEIYAAWATDLDRRLDLKAAGPLTAWCIRHISRFGIGAWGVVFFLIGVFLVIAGWHHNPEEAKSLPDALNDLKDQRHGPLLLGAIGVGLICYSIYDFSLARYRKIKPV
ncbi:MAG TPA: DUF1206 domain-containing protein [Tepidisphaeraceae bacterium]|jgi:hypothetical protein